MRGRLDSPRDISAKLSGEVLRFAAFLRFWGRKNSLIRGALNLAMWLISI
jgi:hypothetical protein